MTLGKYAPFHLGHAHVIETALRECDEVIVIAYDSPSVTPIPLSVRAGWIRTAFSHRPVDVLLAWDGPEETGYTADIMKRQEDYILSLLDGRVVTHFYSSEPYGAHVSHRLGAQDVRVDSERVSVPISATTIRRDPYAQRAMLPPHVYRDLILHVCFLGAPSTGKSTLAARMAQEMDTLHMPEYGREYWEAHHVDRRLTPEQLVEIADGLIQREDALLLNARGVLFTDTNAITTYMFATAYHGSALPALRDAAVRAEKRYDVFFLCGDDIPYADTPDRSGDADRHKFQKQIRADLIERRLPFIELRGDLDTRVAMVKHVLSKVRKWSSIAECLWAA